ncbi:MAG: hypothetical protein WBC21_04035 [Minisyncoccales bacterium]
MTIGYLLKQIQENYKILRDTEYYFCCNCERILEVNQDQCPTCGSEIKVRVVPV